MVKQSAYPRRIAYGETRLGGIWFYANTTGGKNEYLHLVLGICEGPIESVDTIFFGDDAIAIDANGDATTEKYQDHFRAKVHLGDQTTADADLIAEDANWTSNHKLLGIAYVYCRFKHSAEVFDGGLPEVSFKITGANDIEDPRTRVIGYTNLTAACWGHYLRTSRVGPNIARENIDIDYQSDATVICDQDVDLKAGGTEKRYTLDGAFLTDTDPEEIISSMVESMAGWQVFTGGLFRPYAGAFTEPVFSVTSDMVIDAVEIQYRKPRSQRA
ncbi:unnamed protein product, partial [marine sediment metagenome]